MRDRLIELLNKAHESWLRYVDDCAFKQMALSFTFEQMFADYLLANGVIVPPCKVGSKIYIIVTKRSKVSLPPFAFVKVSRLTFYNLERVLQDFGKTVFLTREEAEAELKGEQ